MAQVNILNSYFITVYIRMTHNMSNAIYDEYESYVKKYKQDYGDNVIVFLQCGSFYEIYSCDDGLVDIKTAAEILNITLTRKNKSVQEISRGNCYMIGFPLYTLSKYVGILVQNNFTVVVVSQVTPPPQPKRAVTDVFSPGTMIEDVTPFESNYMMCLFFEEITDWRSQKQFINLGITYMDVSTGTSYFMETSSKPNDRNYALDEAYRLIVANNPREIIIVGDMKTETFDTIVRYLDIEGRCIHDKLNKYDSDIRNLAYQYQLLQKIFPEHGLISPVEYVDMEVYPLALCSYICLLQFTYKHSETILEKIKKPILIQDNTFVNLSYNTAKQLNIVSTEYCPSSLVHILNNCKTAIGKRRFKERLLNPKYDMESLNKDYDMIAYCIDDERYKFMNKMLSDISDLERQFRKILIKRANPTEFGVILRSLERIIDIAKYCVEMDTSFFTMSDMNCLIQKVSNLNIEECNKHHLDNIQGNIFTKGLFTHLDEVQEKLEKHNKYFDVVCEKLNEQVEGANKFFKVEYNDKDGYYLGITAKRYDTFKKSAKNINVIGGSLLDVSKFSVSKPSSTSTSVKLGHPQFKKWNEEIVMLRDTLKKQVTEEYLKYLQTFESFRNLFDSLVLYVSFIDYHATNAFNAITYGYNRPQIEDVTGDEQSYIQAKELRHPIVEKIQKGTEYIANDIELGVEGQNGVLLYGINAAGKSSLMKSIGLSVIMASAGMYVPAREYKFYPYKHIFTRIPTGDNLSKGQSTFTTEIGELRSILKRADRNSLVIGDELCCGTETVSAMSIISAGIITLCQRTASFIFASHLHDLVNLERINTLDNIKVYHLSVTFDESTGKLIYDRILKEGVGKTIYGLEVCKALDLDNDFLTLAQDIRRDILDTSEYILPFKKSRYNSHLYMDVCAICQKKSTDTHHIKEQNTADKNGFIKHFHKNALHNLISVCKTCHNAIHKGEVHVKGVVQTSLGKELLIEKI
jgi:DNA mismatch repair protein MutS